MPTTPTPDFDSLASKFGLSVSDEPAAKLQDADFGALASKHGLTLSDAPTAKAPQVDFTALAGKHGLTISDAPPGARASVPGMEKLGGAPPLPPAMARPGQRIPPVMRVEPDLGAPRRGTWHGEPIAEAPGQDVPGGTLKDVVRSAMRFETPAGEPNPLRFNIHPNDATTYIPIQLPGQPMQWISTTQAKTVANTALGQLTPETAAWLVGGETVGAAVKLGANAPRVVKALGKIGPAAQKTADVAAGAAVPAAFSGMAGKQGVQALMEAHDLRAKGKEVEAQIKETEAVTALFMSAMAATGAAASGVRTLKAYPSNAVPPAEVPVRRSAATEAILEQARPAGVEAQATRPNTASVVQDITQSQQTAKALQEQGRNLAAESWIKRAETGKGKLPSEPLEINGQTYTQKQTGTDKQGRPLFELLDANGKVLTAGRASDIASHVRSRLLKSEPAAASTDAMEQALDSSAIYSQIEEMAQRFKDIRDMETFHASGEDPAMGNLTGQRTTPEQRRAMLEENIRGHRETYDQEWKALEKDLGAEATAGVRQYLESAYDGGGILSERQLTEAAQLAKWALDQQAQGPSATSAEVVKGATFTPEPGKSITVRSVTKSGKVAFTDASGGRTLPMAEFRALVGLPPVQATTPVAETTTPVVAPSPEAQGEPVAPVAQPTSATATPEAEAVVAPQNAPESPTIEALYAHGAKVGESAGTPLNESQLLQAYKQIPGATAQGFAVFREGYSDGQKVRGAGFGVSDAQPLPASPVPPAPEPGTAPVAPGVDAAPVEAQPAQAPAASAEAGAAVRVEPAAKEPWQMTQGEWFDHKWSQIPKKARQSITAGDQGFVGVDEIKRQADGEHRRNIESAIAAGQPVPPEVLADYPDLQVPPISGASSTPEPAAVPPVADVAPVPPGVTPAGAVSPPAPASRKSPWDSVTHADSWDDLHYPLQAMAPDGTVLTVTEVRSATPGVAEKFQDAIVSDGEKERIVQKGDLRVIVGGKIRNLGQRPALSGKKPEDDRKISGKEPEDSTGKESLQVPTVAENATVPDPRLAQIEAHRAKAQELMAQARKLNGRDRKPLLDQAEKEVEEAGRLREEMDKPMAQAAAAGAEAPPDGSPETQEGKARESKREIPSLGETGREIYQGWKRVSGDVMPGSIVVGNVIGVGQFDWRGEKIVRVFHEKARTGYVSTYRDATPQEIEDLHHAIDMGAFQVEQRARYGAGGVREFTNAGEVQKVFHQATGRPLPEWLETDAGKKWQRRLDESMARHAAETESPADETDAPSENAPAAKAPASLAYQNPQGLWIFRNGISQPIGKFSSHEAYARTAGKSEAQLMKEGAIRIRGSNVEAWLPRDLNTPAGRRALELASQYDPYGNVTVSYRGPSEKASFAVYNKPDLEDSGFDLKRTREGIAGAAAMQGRKDKPFILGTFLDEGDPATQKSTGAWERFFAGLQVGSEPGAAKSTLDVSQLARLNDAPIPENDLPTLAESKAYWDGAAVQATTLENVPTLLVNNAGMDAIIQAKTLPNQRPTESSEGSVGLALRPDEWGRVLAASRLAGESLRPGGYDAALVKIGKALKGAIPQGHELGVLILQTGERFPESTVATVAQEELDHALQLKMKGGLAAQPVHLLDTDPIIQKAQEGLILRAGYKRPNPKSPWYDNDRAVMMAEIGVRLMRGNRYQEMNLTPQEASDAMVTYAMALAQVGGEAANDIVEVLYATRKTLDSERRTNQQAQHAPDREGSEAGRNRGGPEGGGLGLSGDSSARAGTGEAPGAAAVLHEAGAERGAGTGIADRSSADLESRAGELGLTISDEPPAGAVALEARTAPTWESLARDVRSLSDEDLKRVWKRRFLRPLREFPGAETVTLEIAGEEDWDALRDTLESFLQEAEAKGMPPAPPSRKEPPKEPPAGGGDGPARAQEGAVYAPRPTAYRGLIDFLKPVSTRIAEQGKAGAVLSKYLTKTQDEGELDAAKRIVRLIDAGLMDLSRDDRANLMDVLEGRADPLDDRVKTAFDAVRKITDEIAASAISSRVIVRVNRKIGPEDEVPEGVTLSPTQEEKLGRGEHIKVSYERGFQALDNYYPHVIPSTDTLKHGQIRNDVVKNLVAQGVAPSEASAAGMIDGYRAFVDSGKRAAELEQYLVDSGQAEDADAAFAMLRRFRSRHIHRQGSLEYSREVDLPFYDPDPARVLPPFVHATSVRLAQIRVFGQKNQRITQLIRLIEQNGGDADFVRGAVDRILSMVDEPDRSAARLSRALRVIQGFKLGLSSIPNVTQGALNTLLKSKDLAAVLSGAQGVLTKKGRRLGLESGAALEGVIDEMVRYTAGEGHLLTTFLKAVGFTATERANRVFAANAGATWASRLLRRLQHDPNDSFARDQLTDLGLNPDALLKQGKLLPDDVLMAAKRMSDLTQFRSDVKDLPYFASSPWGKVIFQFKNYIYGETRLIHDAVVSEFRAGRLGSGFKALLVLMIAFPLAGEAIADIRTLIKGGKIEDRPKGLKRYFDDIAQAGTLGMVQDFAQSASYGRSAEWIAGPTVGEVAETAENIARGVAAGTREKDPTWNFRALGRQAFRRVPIIGTRLANWVFPAKPKASTRGIGSFVGARAGRF